MFDDLGSITTVPDNLLRELQSQGIQVVRYAPVHHFISRLFINYRNHQKITVIDGNIGYTGGTNLADEYANYYPKHGKASHRYPHERRCGVKPDRHISANVGRGNALPVGLRSVPADYKSYGGRLFPTFCRRPRK